MTKRNRDLARRGRRLTDRAAALVLAVAVAAAGSLALLGRAGAAISAPPAGLADPARAQGREAPAPPPGATDGAGNSAQRTR